MTKHVFSTLSAGVDYTDWKSQPGVSTPIQKVTIRGGAGVATSGNGPNIFTPKGVRTEVTDDEAEFLAKHELFKLHQKGGHVTIEDKPLDADKVAESMDTDAGGAPKTQADVKKEADEAAKKSGLTSNETLQVVTNSKAK